MTTLLSYENISVLLVEDSCIVTINKGGYLHWLPSDRLHLAHPDCCVCASLLVQTQERYSGAYYNQITLFILKLLSLVIFLLMFNQLFY
jgi:hypothetical protein